MILCLESSADPSVIGLVDGEDLLAERVFSERDRFADEVENILREAKVSPRRLSQIAVGIGPGSFTGLRVSLAFAKGMARALAIPIWPVSSLKVIAANLAACGQSVAVISPARRGQVHYALFDCLLLEMIEGPVVIGHAALLERLPPDAVLLGPGVTKLEENARAALSDRIPADANAHRPHARHLARLARETWQDLPPPDIGALVPEYGLDFPA
ncbi:MAG: tRNA (adenosine(37)-N6)-threonylcarbamoyltransferase complex dimerization subunit type 1 TsaB [bacterium]|nr:tRNA (adenosine(37)-N6)-threonylcarbamoyltransferase complex dimerization subunit type 1 TsaB [bacterium]